MLRLLHVISKEFARVRGRQDHVMLQQRSLAADRHFPGAHRATKTALIEAAVCELQNHSNLQKNFDNLIGWLSSCMSMHIPPLY
jgi:hypothetical protein